MSAYNMAEETNDPLTVLLSEEIRRQELEWWPDIAANPEYRRVTPDQIDAYYSQHWDEILSSIWPEMPERSEVIAILAHENNTDLFLDNAATHNQEQENGMVMG